MQTLVTHLPILSPILHFSSISAPRGDRTRLKLIASPLTLLRLRGSLTMTDGRTASRRAPVSCEQCRTRKIRCSRDGPPCSTCIRRRISHCAYAGSQRQEERALDRTRLPLPAAIAARNGTADLDLAKRVQRLERLLEEQTQPTGSPLDNADDGYRRFTPNSPGSEHFRRRKVVGGSLKRTESGHVRFVPKPQQWSHDPDQGDCASGLSSEPPLSSNQTSVKELLTRLPPVSQCSELVSVYFRSFASLFHILHDPTFNRQYEAFLEDAETVSLSWLAMLFAILGTAVLALDRNSPVLFDLSRSRKDGKVAGLMNHYRSAAMACLEADHYLWNHNVTTLQALILLTYSIGHSHGRTWTLLGLTHHLAVSLGCHIDPSEFGLSPIESEERRRCWSGLMMLYTSENLSLGNAGLPHHVFPANCSPPADINDDEIGTDMQRTVDPGQATQMAYLLLKFRLYDICADLCERVLDVERPPSYNVVKELDATIENEKRTWSLRYSDDDITPAPELPVYHKAHLKILHSYASHLILILHQAALATARDTTTSDTSWSESKIVMSALQLLNIHSEFEQSPELAPFRWYHRGLGSFHAFHAATILFSSRRSSCGRQRALDILESLQSCAARFESLDGGPASELSPHLSQATPVLRYIWYVSNEREDCTLSLTMRSSRMTVELSQSKEMQANEEMRAYMSDSSSTRPLVTDLLHMALPDSSDSMEGGSSVDQDLDSMLEQFQPQHWLTPASLPWDQWDTWIASAAS